MSAIPRKSSFSSSSTGNRHVDDNSDAMYIILDPNTSNGLVHHPSVKHLSFQLDRGSGTFVHPKCSDLTFNIILDVDATIKERTHGSREEEEEEERDSSRYFLECSMGRLSTIRAKHPNTDILKSLSRWNEAQNLRSKRHNSNRGLLCIDSEYHGSTFNKMFNKKKGGKDVVMTMCGRLGLKDDVNSDSTRNTNTALRHLKLESSVQNDLERFVADALICYCRLND